MISKVSTFLGPSSIFGSGKITLPSLVLYLDAGNTQSYPGTGTAWYDLSSYHNNGLFNTNPTYSNVWGGYIEFGGSNYAFFEKKTLAFDGSSYNVTTGTNSVTSTTGDWENGAWSVESYSGKIKLKFQIGENPGGGNDIICGFSENPLGGGFSYNNVKYGFFTQEINSMSIWESNSEVSALTGTFSTSSVFSIIYDLSSVKYYIDDVLVYTSSNTPTSPLYFYSTFTNTVDTISVVNIEFGPYVEAIPIGDSQYTIETWVQSNNTVSSSGGIIGWGSYGEDRHVNALRYSGSGGYTNYWWGNDFTTSNLFMLDSLYYHVVAKYDGTNRQIWVNGTMSALDTPGTTNSVDIFSNLTVGVSDIGLSEYLDGSIGYLKLYNKSLSDSQIINNYNSTKSRFGYSYGSLLFDGDTQYLSNTSIDYSFGTSDFTMEAFFNHATSSVSYNGILSLRDNTTGGGVDINLQNSDSTPYIEFFANGVANLFTASNDTWYHVAMSRVSGTTSFYVNGNLFTQIEDTTLYTQTNLVIGRYYNDYDGFYYNGAISNVRVINGTGIYTSSFTPPTTPLVVTTGTRLLLLSQENMLVSDSSGNNEIVVNNNGVGWTSSLPKFYVDNGLQFYVDGGMMSSYPGSGSVWYDVSGNSRNLTLDPGVTFDPSLGGWFSFDGSSIAQSLTYSISLSSGFTMEVIFKANNGSGIFTFNNDTTDYINIQSYGGYFRWEVDQGRSMNSDGGISNDTWVHVACTYNGSDAKIYINGSLNSTSSLSQDRTGSQASPFVLGKHDYFLTGGIGMARFYNRPLTQEEVSSNFNNSKTRFGL